MSDQNNNINNNTNPNQNASFNSGNIQVPPQINAQSNFPGNFPSSYIPQQYTSQYTSQQPNQNQVVNPQFPGQYPEQYIPQQPQIQPINQPINQQNNQPTNQPLPQNYNPADPSYYTQSSGFELGFEQSQSTQIPNQPNFAANMRNKFGGKFKNVSNTPTAGFFKKNWWILVSGLVLVVMLSVAATYFLSGLNAPKSNFNQVFAKASSDATVPSGSLGSWKIDIENRENTTLDQVKLYLDFDRTFTFSKSLYQTPDAAQESYPYGSIYSLGQLKPFGVGGSTAQINIQGTLIGDLDTESIMGGHLEYLPVGSSKKISVDLTKAVTKIGAPEVTIDISAPTNIKNGTEGDVYVDFKNSSDKSLSNLRIKLNYPPNSGFKYISSQLQLTKTSDVKTQPDEGDNIWLIPQLPRLTTQELKIHGQFIGVPGELKKLEAEIGIKDGQTGDYQSLAKKAISVTITGEILQVTASLDGKDNERFFTAGETVTLKVAYKNTSTRNLEDVKVLGWMDDPANLLDFSTVAFTGGDRGNYNNGKLEWTQQAAPQLRLVPPNASGELSFSIKVKDGSGFFNGKAQNLFTLRPRALVSAVATDSVEVVGNEYKALGDLKFNSKIERQVTIQPNKNDPNLPNVDFEKLQVGIPASYVVTWTLTSNQTQVNKVRVTSRSALPASVWDQTSVKPITEGGKLSYDKTTGQIVWDVGDIPGYTGSVLPSKTVSFVMTFTPTEPQVNSGVNIYENISVTGTDDFTSRVYQLSGGSGTIK